MELQIENVWNQLNYLISATLNQLRKATPVTTPEATDQLPPASAMTNNAVDQTQQRIKMLRDRLDQLLEALMGGKVSEQLYLGIKTTIEDEITK